MGRKEEGLAVVASPLCLRSIKVIEASCPHAVLDGLPERVLLREQDVLQERGVIAAPDELPARDALPGQDVLLVPAVPQERDATVPVADGFEWAADASRLVEDGSPEFEDGLPAPVLCAVAALSRDGLAASAPDVAAGRRDVHP